MSKTLIDYLPSFCEALQGQLEADHQRWGDTWKRRPVEGQEERTFARYADYADQFRNGGVDVPWLKVIGEAMICWVRENCPEYKDE